MKQAIENQEALLKKLVCEGDAHAFFSLARPFLQQRYLRERSAGTSAGDSAGKVMAEAVELLENVQHISAKHLDAWFEAHCSLEDSPATTGNGELLIDTKIIAETEHFLNRCSRELLRTGSDIKRNAEASRKKFPQVVFRHKAVVVISVILLAALVGAGSTLLLIRFDLAVEIHFLSANGETVLRYPPLAWTDQPDVSAVTHTSEVNTGDRSADSSVTAKDSTVTDSLRRKAASGASSSAKVTDTHSPRSLPPVVPKARLILPPPPPPPPEPVLQDAPVIVDEPGEPAREAVPPPQPPSMTTEPQSTF